MVVVFLLLAILLTFPAASLAAFGLATTTDYYAVDTGAGLAFKVRRTDNGSITQSLGDIMSLVYNGVEYQNQSRGSHINSGFDWIYNYTNLVSVSANVYGTNYFYVVRASNAAGTSANSAQVSARPVSATRPICRTIFAGGVLTLSRPADHTGWRLQVQTNSLETGLGTIWFEVPGSTTTNSLTLPVDSGNGSVFYRLTYP